jgi:hypothetical protein
MHILTLAQLTTQFLTVFLMGFFSIVNVWLLWLCVFLNRAERLAGRITPRSQVAPLGVYVPHRRSEA